MAKNEVLKDVNEVSEEKDYLAKLRHLFMTEEEKAFMISCDVFKDYQNIDEYVEDICHLLIIGIINHRYSRSEAESLIKGDMKYIEEEFENKTDACTTAVNLAYCCG